MLAECTPLDRPAEPWPRRRQPRLWGAPPSAQRRAAQRHPIAGTAAAAVATAMLDRRSEGERPRHASLLTTHALRAVPVAEQLASGGDRHAHGTSNTSTSTDDDGHVAASALSAAQLAAARRQRLPARWQPVSVGDEQVSSRRPGSGVGAPASTRPLHPPPRAAAGSASLHPSRSHVSNNVGHFGRRGEPVGTCNPPPTRSLLTSSILKLVSHLSSIRAPPASARHHPPGPPQSTRSLFSRPPVHPPRLMTVTYPQLAKAPTTKIARRLRPLTWIAH